MYLDNPGQKCLEHLVRITTIYTTSLINSDKFISRNKILLSRAPLPPTMLGNHLGLYLTQCNIEWGGRGELLTLVENGVIFG